MYANYANWAALSTTTTTTTCCSIQVFASRQSNRIAAQPKRAKAKFCWYWRLATVKELSYNNSSALYLPDTTAAVGQFSMLYSRWQSICQQLFVRFVLAAKPSLRFSSLLFASLRCELVCSSRSTSRYGLESAADSYCSHNNKHFSSYFVYFLCTPSTRLVVVSF